MHIDGSCHCENLIYRLRWPDNGDEIPLRKCGCSFCVKHVGSWTSHRDATLSVTVANAEAVSRYRFGTKTADFYVCAVCGVTPFVTSEIDGNLYAVVNINTFNDVASFQFASTATNFDGEDTGSRLDRRKRNWIPNVTISSE